MDIFKGIICMIAVGVCWTLFGFAMGKSERWKVSVPMLMITESLVAVIFFVSSGLVQGLPEAPKEVCFWVAGALFMSGFINYFQLDLMAIAMKYGPNGIVWSLIQAGFILPFMAGIFCLGAQKTFGNISGVLCIIASLMLFGFAKDMNSRGKWKLVTMIALCTTGVSQLLSNVPSYFESASTVSGTWRSACSAFGMASGGLLTLFIRERSHFIHALTVSLCNRYMWMLCFMLLVCSYVENVFFLFPGMDALAKAGVGAIAFPLSVAASIVAFEIYTIVFLHEKRNPLQLIALFVMMLGMVGVCF